MSNKYEIPRWKTNIECKKCGDSFNLIAIAWITEIIYYYTLTCPNCGLSIKGKQKARRNHVPYWEEQRDMAVGRKSEDNSRQVSRKTSWENRPRTNPARRIR